MMDIKVIKRAELSVTFLEARLIREALEDGVNEKDISGASRDSINLMLNELDFALANG